MVSVADAEPRLPDLQPGAVGAGLELAAEPAGEPDGGVGAEPAIGHDGKVVSCPLQPAVVGHGHGQIEGSRETARGVTIPRRPSSRRVRGAAGTPRTASGGSSMVSRSGRASTSSAPICSPGSCGCSSIWASTHTNGLVCWRPRRQGPNGPDVDPADLLAPLLRREMIRCSRGWPHP